MTVATVIRQHLKTKDHCGLYDKMHSFTQSEINTAKSLLNLNDQDDKMAYFASQFAHDYVNKSNDEQIDILTSLNTFYLHINKIDRPVLVTLFESLVQEQVSDEIEDTQSINEYRRHKEGYPEYVLDDREEDKTSFVQNGARMRLESYWFPSAYERRGTFFTEKDDVVLEAQLNEMIRLYGTKSYKTIHANSRLLSRFTVDQLKQRTRVIQKYRMMKEIPLGPF